MRSRGKLGVLLAAITTILALCAPGTAGASVSHDGWGLGIAEDRTNWNSYTTFPDLEGNFARLRPKTFRLQTIWNTMDGRPTSNAWKARTHAMIDKAQAQGAQQITLTLRSNYMGDVNPAISGNPAVIEAGDFVPSATQYKAQTDALVKEFAGDVDFWGPANEPNGAWRPPNAPGGQAQLDQTYLAAYYVALRESVIKNDSPSGKVISPDFGDFSGFTGYIEKYLSHIPPGVEGGWGVAAAWHPYAGVASASTASTTDFTKLVTTGQPIWVTEVGSRADLVGQSTQNTQVNWIINTLGAQLRVTHIFYYQMPGASTGWDTGLVNVDGTPRAAWYTWCKAVHGNIAKNPDCTATLPHDLFMIAHSGTGSGSTELHVLNGADDEASPNPYSAFFTQLPTAWPVMTDQNADFEVADYDGKGKQDLIVVQHAGTASGKTELHVLDGSGSYPSFYHSPLADLKTPWSLVPDQNADFDMADYNGDGILDLFMIQHAGTASGKTELHVLDGSGAYPAYQVPLADLATSWPTVPDQNADFDVANYDGKGRPDLIMIQHAGTASGKTELHVLDGSGAYPSYQVPLADKSTNFSTQSDQNAEFDTADADGDGTQDLFMILHSGVTGSGKVEVHILSGAAGAYTQPLEDRSTPLPLQQDQNVEFTIADW
jgi:FG-GAP-like repeat/Glycosyl hydrolase catalytic core